MHDSEDETSGLFAPLWECLSSPTECVPELPDLNWSFSLPNTCAPIPTAGFAPYVEQIDICPFQDTMHDLMSMVWAAAGLFAAAGMIIRDSRAGS
ncbi:MAG: hypothetical protein ABS84_14095 [Rubrivivax sp. SCN 71-131]|nr:MAG: hypothetical protein ABS84_14095 [Rubrivivax sp. SCN 71-131]